MQKSVAKHSQHVVKRAAPIFPEHLTIICSYCDYNLLVPLSVKPCILISHALFLQSSNLLSPSIDVWTGPHTLRVLDIQASSNKLVIRIRSTKTQILPVQITVFSKPCSPICPVLAWNNYMSVVRPPKLGPAFVIPPARPLTAKVVVTYMKEALMYDSSIDVSKVSMHSLRRGATQSAASSGLSESEILVAGQWKSKSGLKPYLQT